MFLAFQEQVKAVDGPKQLEASSPIRKSRFEEELCLCMFV